MHIAFVYIAEPYQCYHGMGVALALAQMPGVQVDIHYNEAGTLRHISQIERAYAAPPLPAFQLKRSLWVRLAQRMKVFGLMKRRIRRQNATRLLRYDAVVSVENTLADLFDGHQVHPPIVYTPHGSGDRVLAFQPRIARFDLVLPSGQKSAKQMLALGLIRPGHYAIPGYIKLETVQKLNRIDQPPFSDNRPVVLYNPHKDRAFGSWDIFIEPMLKDFGEQMEFNLVVAPHVKMFHRASTRTRAYWSKRSSDHILVDPGSDRSVDNSYTNAASIYVGDISSQVYEFLAEPRPCVFLNAHGADWREDVHYRFWHLGDVVDDPADLMAAIRAAPARHPLYRAAQEEAARQTLGDLRPGAARRAAEAIVTFVNEGSVQA